ncbi:MAG: DUF2391 family protein, partial [Acetobacteraceae bacterium]|nr:DUF2391 family protein [Acetobacteraceae bacterium]
MERPCCCCCSSSGKVHSPARPCDRARVARQAVLRRRSEARTPRVLQPGSAPWVQRLPAPCAVERSGGSRPGAGLWSLFARFTVVGYAIVLLTSFVLLWAFGRTDGTGMEATVGACVVLGFPCMVRA